MIFSFQFFEAFDEQHKHVEAELRNSAVHSLEMEAAQHQAVVDGLTRKYMETMKLQNDKAKLEVSSEIVWAFVSRLPALENRS